MTTRPSQITAYFDAYGKGRPSHQVRPISSAHCSTAVAANTAKSSTDASTP
jgi:hypothetical protein